MITLDCESRDVALWSLSRIYEVPEREIDAFLKGTDLERHCAEGDPQHPAHRELTLLLERALGCAPSAIDRVFWFHLTRAKYDAGFASGILPLNQALPSVWDTILHIFKGTEHERPLQRLREKGIPNFQYRLKVGNRLHAGPYAMLVRESAFRSQEMGNHGYLWLPEIVEDICNGDHDSSGVAIHDTVCASLIPYVVKFWSRKQTNQSCVEAAMYYLYRTAHGQKLSDYANTCFDGEGCAIPREQIVKIERADALHHNSVHRTGETLGCLASLD